MITLPVEATDLVSVPVLEEELLLITYPTTRSRRRNRSRRWI